MVTGALQLTPSEELRKQNATQREGGLDPVTRRASSILLVEDTAAVLSRMRESLEAADRLRARNRDAWGLAAQLAPYLGAACRAAVAEPYPVNRYAAPP
jgi:hypothetical protein